MEPSRGVKWVKFKCLLSFYHNYLSVPFFFFIIDVTNEIITRHYIIYEMDISILRILSITMDFKIYFISVSISTPQLASDSFLFC